MTMMKTTMKMMMKTIKMRMMKMNMGVGMVKMKKTPLGRERRHPNMTTMPPSSPIFNPNPNVTTMPPSYPIFNPNLKMTMIPPSSPIFKPSPPNGPTQPSLETSKSHTHHTWPQLHICVSPLHVNTRA